MSHAHDAQDAHDHRHADAAADQPLPIASGEQDLATAERQYFRSLDQLEQTPEYLENLHREFPEGASEWTDPVSRRSFLGLIGASLGLAGMTSCRKPVTRILPFQKNPAGYAPGAAQYYATCFVSGGYGYGTLVRSNEGRPTKVEGNPQHPASLGGANQFMQGDLLNLYDPARSQTVQELVDGVPTARTLTEFLAFWKGEVAARHLTSGGEGVRFLMPPTTSPTLLALVAEVRKALPKAAFHTWAPVNRDQELAGAQLAFGLAPGQGLDAHYQLDRADVVVSLDADPLALDAQGLRHARHYATRRKITEPGQNVARLYAIEGNFTVTGASADHRFRLRASEVQDAVLALAAELVFGHGLTVPGLDEGFRKALEPYTKHGFTRKTSKGNTADWIQAIAKDLIANKGRCVLVPGAGQTALVHAVTHVLNLGLDAIGKTLVYTVTPESMAHGQTGSLRELAESMEAGRVDTLFCLETNPVYDAPADLDFATRLAKVRKKVHLGLLVDETGRACDWHVNAAHDLEAWGDIRAFDGTISAIQPLIAPLYDGVSRIELLAQLADLPKKTGYDLVRDTWKAMVRGEDFEGVWNEALFQGLLAGSQWPVAGTPAVRFADLNPKVAEARRAAEGSISNLELGFVPDAKLYDGRFSNNAWLQEMPDPLSKLTWDNAALVNQRTAAALGVKREDVLRITANGRQLDVPVWILPGLADWTITLALGYGRQLGPECKVARGSGVSAYALRTTSAMHFAGGVRAEKTGATYTLASTQDHGSLEGRAHVREATLAHFREKPDWAPMMSPLAKAAEVKNLAAAAHAKEEGGPGHGEPAKVTEAGLLKSLWDDPYTFDQGHQWGMVIDLNSCTGCNACVVACVAENNIPTVGKAQVRRNREMHWLRIDRYFSGSAPRGGVMSGIVDTEDPQVVVQPVPCMQCENAPCESVCPVAATVHSPEGLNDMAYNRCIGTRYCSNNCPYKVRHFNYLDYHGRTPETLKMVANPEVTVRHRGVMEKCTYCVQRITHAKNVAKVKRTTVQDGQITPACAQTCPTQAITFGDIRDPKSRVARLKASPLNYAMLSELNVRPRTTYLARIRNPNPDLA
ncbi:MAG: TAT-variant-translocated molybdopterin oxidoreductase [Planctomycetes bacterium]|nr:TAT-variant-translocated molybdopterin oxidoreductase [Planctomycetota bacterium]